MKGSESPTVAEQERLDEGIEAVVHLVHQCQLNEDGSPKFRPLVTMCGWKPRERVRNMHEHIKCSMCMEEPICPKCGANPYMF